MPSLPVFDPACTNDTELLKALLPRMSEDDVQSVKESAGKAISSGEELLKVLLANLSEYYKANKIAGKNPC